MAQYLSINRQKIKVLKPVNALVKEYTRDEQSAEKYDDGHRNIDVEKTKENIVLIDRISANFDKERAEKINEINRLRAERSDGTQKTRAISRKLRADTVDLLMNVVQPSAEFINSLSRQEQNAFFEDVLGVLSADKETYGEILLAVVHYDETTPHMQILTSTLDFQKLTSRASEMVGNKTKMSETQTVFVQAVKEKGWKVERGLKRVDNPEYRNWRDEKRKQGLEVNRHTDSLIMAAEKKSQNIISAAHNNAGKLELIQADKIYRQFWENAKCKVRDFSFKFQQKTSSGEVISRTADENTVKDLKFGLSSAMTLINIGWNALQEQVTRQLERLAELKIITKIREKFNSEVLKEYTDLSNARNLDEVAFCFEKGINTLKNETSALKTKLEVFSNEVNEFEDVKLDFVEFLEDFGLDPNSGLNKDIESLEIALGYSKSYTKLKAEKDACIEAFGFWFDTEKQDELDSDENLMRKFGFVYNDTNEIWKPEHIEEVLQETREERDSRNFDTTNIRQAIQDLREEKAHEKRATRGYSGPSL